MKTPNTLNLAPDRVSTLWKERGVAALVRAMERCEHWVVEAQPDYRADAERLIEEVCQALSAADPEAIARHVSENPVKVIGFMGHLRTGRALAMFSWLVDMSPDLASILISEARYGDDEFGSILIERIGTLERQFLLSRVFSPERIALVLDVLEMADADAESTFS